MRKAAMDSAVNIVRESLGEFTHHFKSSNSFDGFFEPTENVSGPPASGLAVSGWLTSTPVMKHSKKLL